MLSIPWPKRAPVDTRRHFFFSFSHCTERAAPKAQCKSCHCRGLAGALNRLSNSHATCTKFNNLACVGRGPEFITGVVCSAVGEGGYPVHMQDKQPQLDGLVPPQVLPPYTTCLYDVYSPGAHGPPLAKNICLPFCCCFSFAFLLTPDLAEAIS